MVAKGAYAELLCLTPTRVDSSRNFLLAAALAGSPGPRDTISVTCQMRCSVTELREAIRGYSLASNTVTKWLNGVLKEAATESRAT